MFKKRNKTSNGLKRSVLDRENEEEVDPISVEANVIKTKPSFKRQKLNVTSTTQDKELLQAHIQSELDEMTHVKSMEKQDKNQHDDFEQSELHKKDNALQKALKNQ